MKKMKQKSKSKVKVNVERKISEKETEAMRQAGLYSLGFIIGKFGPHAPPVIPLAYALRGIGVNCSYVDEIVQEYEAGLGPKVDAP